MNRFLIPNTTQVPNVLIDVVMRQVSDPALRVLLAIVRKTYGFQKQSDHISLTQLEEITALSRQGVVNGIRALGSLIVVRPGKRECNEYGLNLNVATGVLVNGVDQSTRLTSQRCAKTLVNGVDTQNQIRTKPNESGIAKATELSASRSDKRRIAAAAIPPQFAPSTSSIIGKINELTGRAFRADSKDTCKYLVARLKEGATEADCVAVVEHKYGEWGDSDKMRKYISPVTLFRKDNFGRYLDELRANSDNSSTRNDEAWRKETFINV